jgi:hypothetical protein
MYEEIMKRPMFQTPQMRQGGGIMAGVAPIRGYAEGDFVDSATGMLQDALQGFRTLVTDPREALSPEAVQQLESLSEAEAIGLAEAGQLSEAALLTLMSIHPVLRRLKGLKPRAKPKPGAKMTADDLAQPPSGKRVMSPKDIEGTTIVPTKPKPAPGRVARAKDAVSSATSRVTTPIRTTGRVLKGTAKLGAGAAGAAAATDLATGSDYLSTGLNAALDAALDAGRITKDQYDQFMATPEISALSELLSGPKAPQTPASTSGKKVDEKGDETGGGTGGGTTTKPKTFLDMLKGAGTQFKDFLQDPANRYALAKAGQASEGIAPRNFASDFTLGKEEYRQLEAQREKGTALEDNLKLLRELKPEASVDELLDLLLSKDTASDQLQRMEDRVYSLFSDLSRKEMNFGRETQDLMNEARAIVYGNMGLGVPPTVGQGETIDLEPTE